jgi:hypothetical protein
MSVTQLGLQLLVLEVDLELPDRLLLLQVEELKMTLQSLKGPRHKVQTVSAALPLLDDRIVSSPPPPLFSIAVGRLGSELFNVEHVDEWGLELPVKVSDRDFNVSGAMRRTAKSEDIILIVDQYILVVLEHRMAAPTVGLADDELAQLQDMVDSLVEIPYLAAPSGIDNQGLCLPQEAEVLVSLA